MRLGLRATLMASALLVPALGDAQPLAQEVKPRDPEVLEGTFQAVYGRPQEIGGDIRQPLYFLSTETQILELDVSTTLLSRLGGARALAGRRVRVSGALEHQVYRYQKRMRVQKLEPLGPIAVLTAARITGSQPWVSLLCRFADQPTDPEEPAFFTALMGSTRPGMDHYWREVSYDTINLAGSRVFGWFELPEPRNVYAPAPDAVDLGRLARDCTAAADSEVDFTGFVGINLMFSDTIGCCAWGTRAERVSVDGKRRTFHMTWMPPWGFRNQSVLGQEMGHGFGLPHSSGPYNATYDSLWDVMSGGGVCSDPHPEFTCLGVHTIAYHKDLLGWIPDSRKRVITEPGTFNLDLGRLAQPSSTGLLMVRIPLADRPDEFYTVEDRRLVGYDDQLPGQAVVLHQVDPDRRDRNARVVDVDNDSDTNDEGAMWLPGETFSDTLRELEVRVNNSSSEGSSITVSLGGRRLIVERTGDLGHGKVVSDPPGISCGSACVHDYATRTRVSLTAVPDPGSRLKRWIGCFSSGSTCSVTLTSDRTVTAEFTCEYNDCYDDCLQTCLDDGDPHSFCVPSCRAVCETTCE